MPAGGINTVCFIGAGSMGCSNAILAAISGYDVVMFDISEATLDAAPAIQQEMGAYIVGTGYCGADDIAPALGRIRYTSDLTGATANADLVSESVPERLDVKRDIHAQLDAVCPPHTIITTNTSGFLVSEIEDVVGRGDRFAALHSHLGSLLIDIVGGPRTSAETISLLNDYVLSLSGVPLILKKEHPGYVMNSMLGPVLAIAKLLVIGGHADIEAVDRAWMAQHKTPIGPFGMMDLFGLDIVYDSWQKAETEPFRIEWQTKISAFLQPYIDEGSLGRKTGSGFYRYPDASYETDDFLSLDGINTVVSKTLLAIWIQSAVTLLIEDVADRVDIDRAWTVSTGHAAGPLSVLESLGYQQFLDDYYLPAVKGGFIPREITQSVSTFLRANADLD